MIDLSRDFQINFIEFKSLLLNISENYFIFNPEHDFKNK